MGLRIRVRNEVVELSDDSAAQLLDKLTRMGQWKRGQAGERVPLSVSAVAATALHDALQSRETLELNAEGIGSLRWAIEDWANHKAGGFEALPRDVVELRHTIAR